MTTVLQIVPHFPGTYDGVGDYALNLAKALRRYHDVKTIFVVGSEAPATALEEFEVRSGLDLSEISESDAPDHVILHYVNYGYQERGVPLQLRKFSRLVRNRLRGRWITMFHELYASGAPWKSAFWLRPFQVKIARDIIDVSDVCFVSNEVIKDEILRYDSHKQIRLRPIMSNLGEPAVDDLNERPLRNWAICGGATLIMRSLRAFAVMQKRIPQIYFPERLEVIGGWRDEMISDFLGQIEKATPGLSCRYNPETTEARASEILQECSFGWLDYFGGQRMWPGMIFKSGSFAAFCAHGIIPILAHEESTPSVDGETFPGLFSITSRANHFPAPERISDLRHEIYCWYHHHASAQRVASDYAQALV